MASTEIYTHIRFLSNFKGIKSACSEHLTKKIMNSIVYIIGAVVVVVVVLKVLGLF